MAKKTAARKPAAALDVKALSAELGATVKEGRVSKIGERYFLTLGPKKLAIPVGTAVSRKDIGQLVGKSVPVLVSGTSIIAIGRVWGPICFGILCYVPSHATFGEFQEVLRGAAVDQLERSGKINPALAQKLREGRSSVQIVGG